MCLTPAGIWVPSFRCRLFCFCPSEGNAPQPLHAPRHPEKAPRGLETGCSHVTFPEPCPEGVPRGALVHATSLSPPRVRRQGSPLGPSPSAPRSTAPKQPASQVGVSIRTRRFGFPEKDPTCPSAPWRACSNPGCCCVPAAVCEQLTGTWDRVRLGEVGDQRQEGRDLVPFQLFNVALSSL